MPLNLSDLALHLYGHKKNPNFLIWLLLHALVDVCTLQVLHIAKDAQCYFPGLLGTDISDALFSLVKFN